VSEVAGIKNPLPLLGGASRCFPPVFFVDFMGIGKDCLGTVFVGSDFGGGFFPFIKETGLFLSGGIICVLLDVVGR